MSTAGPNVASSVQNGNDGLVDWVNPGNVGVDDNSYASCDLESGDDPNNSYSENLVCYNFGFAIDETATITGILVSVSRLASESGNMEDYVVRLLKVGSIVGNNKAVFTSWGSSEVSVDYGGSSDLWGESWLYSDINNSGFGLVFKVFNGEGHGGNTQAYVDFIRITIYYSLPSGEQSFRTKINFF
jgi:hypothetical protein